MGLFNRKSSKKSDDQKKRMEKLTQLVKDFITDDQNDDVSILFMMIDKKEGYSIIKGDAQDLTNACVNTHKKDDSFRSLMSRVNSELSNISSTSSNHDSKIQKRTFPKNIDLSNGEMMEIDPDNLTDENVDKIVDMILKTNKERGNDS